MANHRKKGSTELDRLKEDIVGSHRNPSTFCRNTTYNTTNNMSGRNNRRSQGRNSTNNSQRNNLNIGDNDETDHEAAQRWANIKHDIQDLVESINAENASLGLLLNLDREMGAMDPNSVTGALMSKLDTLCRAGVKLSEANVKKLTEVITQLEVLRAIVIENEERNGGLPPLAPMVSEPSQAPAPSKKASARDKTPAAASLYDFDAAPDSPGPSPIGPSSRKNGERSSNRDRDSVSLKADSVEPQGAKGSGPSSLSGGPPSSTTAAAAAAAVSKSKVVFQKGDQVAFKPKGERGEAGSDWIQGEVAQVLGEGKSRRYRVLDVEPDDQSKQKEYRTSASSMIAIPPESQVASLPDWEPETVVLALYPNTTTFYRADVFGTGADGRVDLKFEGENDSSTTQQVDRRFVIEYRA